MEFKDYYEIMGLAPDAIKEEIQQTFRILAQKYHPDMNPDNKEAEDYFKRINEAYQILSNIEKRKKYDEQQEISRRSKKSERSQQSSNWLKWTTQTNKVPYVQYTNAKNSDDLFGSNSLYSKFFTNVLNQSGKSHSHIGIVPLPQRGRDIEYTIDLSLKEAYQGVDRFFEIYGYHIKISIPPGVRTGSRLRFLGQGEPGSNYGPYGNLFLTINILPSETFEREGDNLFIEVAIDLSTAISGGETQIPTMEHPLILNIPAQTNAQQSFRLRDMGMPHLGDPKTHGDLYARVRLVLPVSLTDQEANHNRKLTSRRSVNFVC